MRHTRRAAFCVILALCASLAFAQRKSAPPLEVQEAAPRYAQSVAVFAVHEGEGAAAFAESLAAALARELAAAGFGTTTLPAATEPLKTDSDLARAVSSENLVRWTALARCSTDPQGRLLWRAVVYDALDGALIAADSQGSYGGLSALPLLEESARAVAVQASALKDRRVPGRHIEYRIRFISPDEGALVSFGSGEGSREAGIVQDGGLTAPFTAFRAGDPLVVTVSKEGFWTKTTVIPVPNQDREIHLPPLMRRTTDTFALGLATGRLLGLTAEYRRYLSQDALFLKAADSLWFQYTFQPGSIPILHNEVRLGAGVYLFRPRDARFRMAMGTGASGIITLILGGNLSDKFYFDATLEPVWFSWEWHFPEWALFLDQRTSYSLGLSSGLLEREWVEIGHMPFILTLGIVKKW